MPLLSTFGAASARGLKSSAWETATQFFAIGGGGAGKLDSIAFAADPNSIATGAVNAVSYTANSAGYPGQVASNTEFVPMTSQTLRYRASGTNADGSGPQLKIKSGESYSVIIGAGGASGGAGGSTSLVKSTGDTIVTAAGGAASPGTTAVTSNSLNGPNGAVAYSYRPPRYDSYFDPEWGWYQVYVPTQYAPMAATYGLGFRPLGSNASVTSASQTVIREDGSWNYYAYNYFGAQTANLPHGPIMRARTTDGYANGVDGQSTESLALPMLPSDLRVAGGVMPEGSLSRPYWDWTQANNGSPAHAYYGAFGNFTMGYSYPDYLFASSSGYSGDYTLFGYGGGAGSGDPAGNSGSFVGLSPGGNGAFVLSYPASMPPLSSTTGLADDAMVRLLGLNDASGNTQNPKIVNKNGVDYRVYLWTSSGSFTV